jgi:hypothetical protein
MANFFNARDDIPQKTFSSSPLLSPSQSANSDMSEECSSVGCSDASSYDLQNLSSFDDSPNEMLSIQARIPVVGQEGHIVQFYYDEEYLYNSIVRYVYSCSFTL